MKNFFGFGKKEQPIQQVQKQETAQLNQTEQVQIKQQQGSNETKKNPMPEISVTASEPNGAIGGGGPVKQDAVKVFSNEPATLRIVGIKATELKAVETFGGANDDYIKLKFGSKFDTRTETKNDAGSDAEWSYGVSDTGMQFVVTPAELQQSTMEVVAMDANNFRSDVEIGRASENLPLELLESEAGKIIDVRFQLKDKSMKPSGIVVLSLCKHVVVAASVAAAAAPKSVVEPAKEVAPETSVKESKAPPQPQTTNANVADLPKESNGGGGPVKQDAVKVFSNEPATLRIVGIKATDLKAVETFGGANDDYIKLKFGSKFDTRTETKNDAGSDAEWSYGVSDTGMQFVVTPAELQQSTMEVVAMDANNFRSDVEIGRASENLPLELLESEAGKIIDVRFQLKDKSMKPSGIVVLSLCKHVVVAASVAAAAPKSVVEPAKEATLEASLSENQTLQDRNIISKTPAIQEGSKEVTLRISRIEARNLKAVERFGGKNDDFVEVKFGTFSAKTSTINEGGANVDWTFAEGDQTMRFKATSEELNSLEMEVVVMDENTVLSNVEIGRARSILPFEIVDSDPGREFKVEFSLKDSSKKSSGVVTVVVTKYLAPIRKQSSTVQKDSVMSVQAKDSGPIHFDTGLLKVKTIKCSEMRNVERGFDKNDLYVTVELGISSRKTNTVNEAGASALFDFLDFQFAVDVDTIQFVPLTVRVLDKNTLSSDVLIGTGNAPLASLLETVNEMKEIGVDVLDDKGKRSGHVLLQVQLCPHKEAKEPAKLSDDFAGVFRVLRVCAYELKNTTALLSATVDQPFLKISLAGTNVKTEALESKNVSQGNAVFEYIDFEAEVRGSDALLQQLIVEVGNHAMIGDSIIGKGSTNLLQCELGVEQELSIEVLDKKGGIAGRLVVFGVLDRKIESDGELAVILDGRVCIDSVIFMNLRNTELIGKQDPFAVLTFAGWSEKTSAQDNAGAQAKWEHLGYFFDVAGEDVVQSKLRVEAFDENTIGANVSIGSIDFSLQTCAGKYDTTFDLKGELKDTTGKKAGTAVLKCRFIETPVEQVLTLPDGLPSSEFVVKRITAHGLTGSNMFTALQSFVSISVSRPGADIWNLKTDLQTGNDPHWDVLDLNHPVTKEEMAEGVAVVEIWQKGLINDSLIASSSFALLKLSACFGKELEIPLVLKTNKGVDSGRLSMLVVVKEERAKLAVVEEIQIPQTFVAGMLLISYAQAKSLRNTELLGKADPYLIFKFDDWEHKTDVCEEAGGFIVYDDLDVSSEISRDQVIQCELIVEAWDKNDHRGDAFIGSAKMSLRRAVVRLGKEVELVFNLMDKKGAVSGQVALRLEVRSLESISNEKLPDDFQGLLHVYRLRTFDLKNTEIVGLQDPFLVVKFGEFSAKTFTQENKGGDVTFDFLDIKAPVSAQSILSMPLELEAWDENTLINALIGKGKTRLKKLNKVGQEAEYSVSLKDDKNKPSGRISVFCRLEEAPPPIEKVVVNLPEDVLSGNILIRRICVFGLRKASWVPGDKQDPWVTVKIGDETLKTNTVDNAGANCIWDYLDFAVGMERTRLLEAELEVAVNDKNNFNKHYVLGTGQVSIKRALANFGKLTELSVDLMNGDKAAGRLVLYVEVQKPSPPLILDPKFSFGVLRISKIRTFDLKNTEMFGLQDPFCVLNVGTWSEKTFTKQDGGSDVLWDFLDFQCDVFPETILEDKLKVTVFDENVGRAHALIGNGEVSLLPCGASIGKEQELSIILTDEKGKGSGRLLIFASIEPPETAANVPADLLNGILSITKISILNLKNTEWFGKADPFVVVKLNSFSQSTKALSNAGSNVTWEHLDFKISCDERTIRVGEISIEAWDKNDVRKSVMIGLATVPIVRAGCHVGEAVELFGTLKDTKGNDVGRILLNARMDKAIALAKADLGLPTDFEVGVITISKIQVKGLQNKEIMGKQDPFVRVSLDDWFETTATKPGAGGSVTWTDLTMEVETNRKALESSKFKVTVMDENTTRQDSFLGSGSSSLRRLCGGGFGKEIELSFELNDVNGASVGIAILLARLKKADLSNALDMIPESSITLAQGKFTVSKICGFDLLGGDAEILGDKPDPYLVLSCGDFVYKTSVLQNGGRCPVWDNISDCEVMISADEIRYKRLSVSVMDKNLMSDALMGSGDITLKGLGSKSDVEGILKIKLKGKRGQSAGRLEIYAKISAFSATQYSNNEEEVAKGVLQLARAEVLDLQKSFIAPDLYLVFKAGDKWKPRSELQKGVVQKCNWALGLESPLLVVPQLEKSGLQVSLMSSSKIGDSVVGTAKLSLDETLSGPGTWCDIKAQLMEKKTVVGRIVVRCNFLFEGEENTMKDEVAVPIESGPKNVEVTKNLADQAAPVASLSSEALDKLSSRVESIVASQETLSNLVVSMEQKIRKKLQQEFEQERNRLLEELRKKEPEPAATVNPVEPSPPQARIKVSPIQTVKLPSDLSAWRTVHAQAWIAFKMELPEYSEAFQEASLDGIMLGEHVAENELTMMGISNTMHRDKILEGIKVLKAEYESFKLEKEKKQRLEEEAKKRALEEKLRREKEERERRRLEEERRAQDLAKKKNKKKSTGKVAVETAMNQGVVNRAVLETKMRKKHRSSLDGKEKSDRESKIWPFEYTGNPPPVNSNGDIWEATSNLHRESPYEKMMRSELMKSEEFYDLETSKAPGLMAIRTIPENCFPEEILAVIKGAMFQVSTWLLELDLHAQLRRTLTEKDVEAPSFGTSAHEVGEIRNARRENGEDKIDNAENDNVNEEEEEDDDLPPPAFSEDVEIADTWAQTIPKEIDEFPKHVNGATHDFTTPDRMTLIFNAFVNRRNNGAPWLSSNNSLTRLKFAGGLESVLRLQLSWSQFDALWTRLDSRRSGDLDINEFKAFFGDLSEFEMLEGTAHLSLSVHDESMSKLTQYLYMLCDSLRYAGFTVTTMFSSFDRNGSGSISISEFCSLLRLVVGSNIDKKVIYRAITVLDSDGDKSISLEEVSTFIYKVWKSQLAELAEKLAINEETPNCDQQLSARIVKERNAIKDAIKRNYPREWRDRLERVSTQLPGPFTALLERMNIGPSMNDTHTTGEHVGTPAATTANTVGPRSPIFGSATMSSPRSKQWTRSSKRFGATTKSGRNELLRYKIRLPAANRPPTREGTVLTVPKTVELGGGPMISSEKAATAFKKSDVNLYE